jgi:hypothetical protein
MRTSTPCLIGLASVALFACGTDVAMDDDPDPDPVPRATWYQDVAPIVAEKCMGCHQTGGIGPFDLTTYDMAAENAGRMVAEIEKGAMPPFDARESDDCTPRFGWVDDPRLSAQELDTIKLWIEDGLAEGTVAEIPDPPDTSLAGVTKTLKPVVPFVSSGTRDQFICYVLDPQMPAGGWLTGLQVRPGNPLVVHHVVVNELMPGAEHDAVVAERGIGMPWECGDANVPGGFVVNVWTPGNQPMQTSGDLAVPILGGAKLVMQLHYHPAGMTAEPDATMIDLRTSTVWPKKMYFVGAFGNEFQAPALLADPDDRGVPEFRIPANAADHNEHMRITVPSLGDLQEVQLYSVNPHMHMVGTQISAKIERPAARGSDPQNECLANGAWNFDWQRTYIYDTALETLPTLRPGDVIDLRCKWNNTMDNPFVQRLLKDEGLVAPVDLALGEGSTDEMCLEIFGFAIDAPAQPALRTAPVASELPMQLLEILNRN